MVELKGIVVPIVTPMNEDETINTDELRRQVDRQIEAGIHGIFPFGTNGEGYILNFDEKKLVLQTVIDQVAGRVPVYAGTGCISTKETIEQCKMAMDCGADVLSVITPSFAKASQHELIVHYETVAAAVPEAPIVLYNIPARTGNALAPETVAELAKIDNIVGAKDSSGDWTNLSAYIELTKDMDFAVLSGNDSLILKALQAGAKGAIAGCANVYPKNMVGIYENFKKGDLEAAQKCQDAVAPLRACFKYGNPNTVVKTAVNLLGYPVGKCRAPFNYLPEEGIEALKQTLADDKAKGMC
ncbi:MAG: 4-hydroxy-tetrahydrodipicolinate synthase [Atopobiaceae bacterium]|jgi:4-hydroxy-tetrahydrodipicolinate synthase|nr:4-hydroxy-tetrahydrodipicolinate synthase [Olsenella sp.]MDY3970807.1 4-hydroxy-tetrahydrodipicolinate synthase [Atopobiaceae bacterium]MDY5004176.1 4-hydroxy-tetrahydrodipicolinate synthase [Atopobiaceae bacterium]MDY5275868.1 4-hydroxy-tetrahydrodipicolinate synthase [Atopobiaceae bacterium]